MNWKGRLKYSGRMNKKGIEITQKTMNPTISYVVVGTLEANVSSVIISRPIMHTNAKGLYLSHNTQSAGSAGGGTTRENLGCLRCVPLRQTACIYILCNKG